MNSKLVTPETMAAEAINHSEIKIRLEQWACTVAILGGCVTYAFVSWLNRKNK